MTTWGINAAANTNVPKCRIQNNVAPRGATVNNFSLFMNTTPRAVITAKNAPQHSVVGLYGVSANLAKIANTSGVKNISPGWVLRKSGMGGVTSFAGLPVGTGYSNNDLVIVTGNGCVNVTANVSTNSSGGILALTNVVTTNASFLAFTGGMFPNVAFPTVAITNTTGGTANGSGFTAVTVKLGGRAGRVSNELLVSVRTMSGNSTLTSNAFPNA